MGCMCMHSCSSFSSLRFEDFYLIPGIAKSIVESAAQRHLHTCKIKARVVHRSNVHRLHTPTFTSRINLHTHIHIPLQTRFLPPISTNQFLSLFSSPLSLLLQRKKSGVRSFAASLLADTPALLPWPCYVRSSPLLLHTYCVCTCVHVFSETTSLMLTTSTFTLLCFDLHLVPSRTYCAYVCVYLVPGLCCMYVCRMYIQGYLPL